MARPRKNMTVDAKNHTVTLSLSIPVTEAARVGSLNVENILKGYAVRGARVFDAQDGYYLTVSTQNGRVNGGEVTGTIADALTGDAVFPTRAMSARWKSPRSWRARAITTAWP